MGDVYLLESPSGKKYVGQAVERLPGGRPWGHIRRWKAHISEARRNLTTSINLNRAIMKYGADNFKVSLLYKCSSQDEMNEKECFYIKELNTLSPNGYNLTTGGRYWKDCEETRQKKIQRITTMNIGKQFRQRPRKNPEHDYLPRYMREFETGFKVVNHPSKISKSFTSKKIPKEENYKNALEFLNKLNEHYFKNKEKSSSTKQYSDEVSDETKS
jgi:group I intron endonuclease